MFSTTTAPCAVLSPILRVRAARRGNIANTALRRQDLFAGHGCDYARWHSVSLKDADLANALRALQYSPPSHRLSLMVVLCHAREVTQRITTLYATLMRTPRRKQRCPTIWQEEAKKEARCGVWRSSHHCRRCTSLERVGSNPVASRCR